jgi:hypothetical protein
MYLPSTQSQVFPGGYVPLESEFSGGFVLISKRGNQPVFLAQRVNKLCPKQGEKISPIHRDMGEVCA